MRPCWKTHSSTPMFPGKRHTYVCWQEPHLCFLARATPMFPEKRHTKGTRFRTTAQDAPLLFSSRHMPSLTCEDEGGPQVQAIVLHQSYLQNPAEVCSHCLSIGCSYLAGAISMVVQCVAGPIYTGKTLKALRSRAGAPAASYFWRKSTLFQLTVRGMNVPRSPQLPLISLRVRSRQKARSLALAPPTCRTTMPAIFPAPWTRYRVRSTAACVLELVRGQSLPQSCRSDGPGRCRAINDMRTGEHNHHKL
jgi:hypothetical protein